MDVAKQNHAVDKWRATLQRVAPCCVVLKVTSTRSFDTESAGSSFATGFVVDRKKGIILTNRHVVKSGPVTAEAVFLNREELPVYPLYRDPVHDFGFVRFDPKKLRFLDVDEVPLAPEAASVGIEIRVVGNDSGEKISILAGTLARLDRDAPHYSSRGFNDFNTFYLQAASGTKGGSSGSPVIDIQGRAIGLNAGSRTKSASAFFLPLDRVVRALDLCRSAFVESEDGIQWQRPDIPRGDLQATFSFKGFDEVRRLGLDSETEAMVRGHKHGRHGNQPEGTIGMLVVESRVPKGPADGKLEPGDVLVKISGKTVTHFLDMEEILDASVGADVDLDILRGGKMLNLQITVEDLHRVTPNCFLEMCGGSVNSLSYQQARNFNTHTGQVYVSDPGYMLSRAHVPKHSVILSLNGQDTPDLNSFASVLSKIPHATQVPVQFLVFSDRYRKRQTLMHMDRRWYGPPTMWSREDAEGCWRRTIPSAKDNHEAGDKADKDRDAGSSSVAEVDMKEPADSGDEPAQRGGSNEDKSACEIVGDSLVLVDVEIPEVALADGVHSKSFIGNGIIVYQSENVGIVLVDRNTVAIGPCDVRLSFSAFPVETEGTVRFLHPLHNFAMVSYNPCKLPPEARAAIKPCTIASEPPLCRGDKVTLVGLSRALRLTAREASVTNATVAMNLPTSDIPRFHAVNEEVIELDQDFGAPFSGILIDRESASMRALWASFSKQVNGEEREFCAGIHSYTFSAWIDKVVRYVEKTPDSLSVSSTANVNSAALATVSSSESVPIPVMDVEFNALLLSKATNYGLPQDWVKKLSDFDSERKQVLRVKSCVARSDAKDKLNEGDMILTIDGELVSSFRDVKRKLDDHCSNGSSNEGLSSSELRNLKGIELTVLQNKVIRNVTLDLDVVDGLGTDRLVHWAGAQLQDSYRSVRERGYVPECNGVYISRWHHGSPAHRYGLYALHWILEVNGTPTPDLETFLNETSALADESFVRLKVCHLDNRLKVITLRLDHRFWPTWELTLDHASGQWFRKVDSSQASLEQLQQ
eukprot:CAMPEP_0198241736 /NCGR_PEP_ID=MMETSP1446-20131203/6471_1 /TAXON_ID=1461542 ORGANISM="Unidentified sp, Strain CCMP2111" /NCGR_SAMPLE_ID=MMETSP1446 /ASSEMBLY_ACC=CAM_ASM_001112 /LENGTH=1038 /DNA_ID=CAMNT_0043924613 /DNA_START=27 /DNA_END=3143 /DNA_ORIENTATION=+